jgi:Tol biopolymer transport system component/DNA-binding winged helix-turn-helix (wHTH) protein
MNSEAQQVISFAEFELDTEHRRLFRDGNPLELYAKTFDLLAFLVERNGKLVSRDEILEKVWEGQFVEDTNLSVQISALRKALGEKKNAPRFLLTVPGKGYKFVADLNPNINGIVIEKHRISRLVVEETEEKDEGINFRSLNFSLSQTFAVGAFSVLLVLAFGIYQYFNWKKVNTPFERLKFTRLTNSGKVAGAAISPDGKFIAYVLGERDGNSIWIQQVGTANNLRLVSPVKAEVYELTFTPDGSHIFYSLFAADQADLKFFRISSLGGISEQIHNIIASYLTFAPDGKRLAYAQSDSSAGQNYLVIADTDGANQQRIATKKYPNSFETQYPVVSWSPDAETIACLVRQTDGDANYFSIVGINSKDGREKLLSTERWSSVWGLEWVKDGSGLLISASEKPADNFQVYFVSYPKGEKRQITNDLNQYNSLSTTADGQSFAGVQTTSNSSIFVGQTGADANEFVEIISETGGLYPIEWTPGGKIIYRSNKDGVSNLWAMDADGGNRRQLTTNAQVKGRNLCISPDGKYIVFESKRNGNINLWRIDADGGNLLQLTNGQEDSFPNCSPDNRTIVFQRGKSSKPRLWKVDLEGGEPVQLTDFFARGNAISPDNRRISYFFMDRRKWRIGIISFEGGPMLEGLEVPSSLDGNLVRWRPDNQSLFYISTTGNVGNIGILPLDGSEPKLMTNFKSHLLEGYSWSPDRQKLAVVRSANVSDIVLITNEKAP